jgi:hypothetical protein
MHAHSTPSLMGTPTTPPPRPLPPAWPPPHSFVTRCAYNPQSARSVANAHVAAAAPGLETQPQPPPPPPPPPKGIPWLARPTLRRTTKQIENGAAGSRWHLRAWSCQKSPTPAPGCSGACLVPKLSHQQRRGCRGNTFRPTPQGSNKTPNTHTHHVRLTRRLRRHCCWQWSKCPRHQPKILQRLVAGFRRTCVTPPFKQQRGTKALRHQDTSP